MIMPRKTAKTSPKTKVKKIALPEQDLKISEQPVGVVSKKNKFPKLIPVLLLMIVVLGLLGYLFKDKIVVAVVNGKPIFRYELSQRLVSNYGKEALENIIVEELVKEEAKKQKVDISEEDLNAEIERIKGTLGGMKLEDALGIQGLSLDEFKTQIKIRLQVNRILEKTISVTDEEINEYVKTNTETLTATSEAEKRTEAAAILKEQKIGEKIQSWVSELLSQAKISRFLK